jgi:hypothetical protein
VQQGNAQAEEQFLAPRRAELERVRQSSVAATQALRPKAEPASKDSAASKPAS